MGALQAALAEAKQWESRYSSQMREAQTLANEIESLNRLLVSKNEEFQAERKRLYGDLEAQMGTIKEQEVTVQKLQANYQMQLVQLAQEYEERIQQEVRYRSEEVSRLTQVT